MLRHLNASAHAQIPYMFLAQALKLPQRAKEINSLLMSALATLEKVRPQNSPFKDNKLLIMFMHA